MKPAEKFVAFRYIKDPECFDVGDQAHAPAPTAAVCPTPGGEPERIGKHAEKGPIGERATRRSPRRDPQPQYYLLSAKSFSAAE